VIQTTTLAVIAGRDPQLEKVAVVVMGAEKESAARIDAAAGLRLGGRDSPSTRLHALFADALPHRLNQLLGIDRLPQHTGVITFVK
jgi:hypothetical protein